jgi:hypothetical protein
VANDLDESARVLIDFALRMAVRKASDEKTESYIKNAFGLTESADIKVILRLTKVDIDNPEDNQQNVENKVQKKTILTKLKKIDKAAKHIRMVHSLLNDDLKKIQKPT